MAKTGVSISSQMATGMRLILKYVILILMATSSIARSESRSTKDDQAVVDLKILLWGFKKQFSRYPESWSEAVEKLDLPTRMIPSMEKNIDFANRYRLVNIDGVKIGAGVKKIVAMPGDSGKEGINKRAQSQDEVSGRKLIVEDSNGKLLIVRLSDKELVSSFAGAGLKLETYTWAPSKNAPFVPRRTYAEELRDRKMNSSHALPTPEVSKAIAKKEERGSEAGSTEPIHDRGPSIKMVWVFVGASLVVIIGAAVVVWSRRKS